MMRKNTGMLFIIGILCLCGLSVAMQADAVTYTRKAVTIETAKNVTNGQSLSADKQDEQTLRLSFCYEGEDKVRVIVNHPWDNQEKFGTEDRVIAGLFEYNINEREAKEIGGRRYGRDYIDITNAGHEIIQEECEKMYINVRFVYDGFPVAEQTNTIRALVYNYNDQGELETLTGWRKASPDQDFVLTGNTEDKRSTLNNLFVEQTTLPTGEPLYTANVVLNFANPNIDVIDNVLVLINKNDTADRRRGLFKYTPDGCREYTTRYGNDSVELRTHECERIYDPATETVTFRFPFTVVAGAEIENNILGALWQETAHKYSLGWNYDDEPFDMVIPVQEICDVNGNGIDDRTDTSFMYIDHVDEVREWAFKCPDLFNAVLSESISGTPQPIATHIASDVKQSVVEIINGIIRSEGNNQELQKLLPPGVHIGSIVDYAAQPIDIQQLPLTDFDEDGIVFGPYGWNYYQETSGQYSDNCPFVYNPDQANADGDWQGDVCDTGEEEPTPDPDPSPNPDPTPEPTEPLPASTVTVVTNSLPAPLERVETYGSFISGGLDIQLDRASNIDVSLISVRLNGEDAHPLTKYDANHAATSFFGLTENTTYTVELTLPDGSRVTTELTTKPAWSLERTQAYTQRTVHVRNETEWQAAIANIRPGDEIILSAGTYSGMTLFEKNGAGNQRIVIRGAENQARPTIIGDIEILYSSFVTLHNLEVIGMINVRGSQFAEIVGNNIHDNEQMGARDHFIFIQHADEIASTNKDGYHLVLNNAIHDDYHGQFRPVEQAPNQTYFGIKQDFGVGGYTTIAGNHITGVADGISPGGDEGQSPVSKPTDPNVKHTWPNRELDIYDNQVYNISDDCYELDGHGINVRLFQNKCGHSTNAISTAQVFPGPIFITHNTLYGFQENSLKMNTAVAGITRNVYFYHNTIKQAPGASYALYRGFPARTQDIVLRNNIIDARGRIIETDIGSNTTCEYYHKNHDFDNDLLWSARENEFLFKWGFTDWGDNRRYRTFEAFKNQTANPNYLDEAAIMPNTRVSFACSDQHVIAQEPNGILADPQLQFIPSNEHPEDPYLGTLTPSANSPAIDNAVLIPGINNTYSGNKPDIGAKEVR